MGISSSRIPEPNNLDSLQARMDKLEKAADLDGDGIVTKKELKEYSAKEIQLRDSEILMLRAEKTRLEQELIHLRDEMNRTRVAVEKETSKWIKAYDTLHASHEAYLEKEKEDHDQKPQTISNKAVERFVDELLADPNINIYMLPDTIERPLYVNTLKILLNIIQKMFNHTNLDLIGHEVKMQMHPTLETQLQDQE